MIFSDPSRRERELPISIVVDLDWSGRLIGLEVINLTLQAGKKALVHVKQTLTSAQSPMRYSYDGETDSFYLRLHVGDSSNQRSIVGTLFLDNDDQIVGIKVPG